MPDFSNKKIAVNKSNRLVKFVEDTLEFTGNGNLRGKSANKDEFFFPGEPADFQIEDLTSYENVPEDLEPNKYFFTETGEFEVNPFFQELLNSADPQSSPPQDPELDGRVFIYGEDLQKGDFLTLCRNDQNQTVVKKVMVTSIETEITFTPQANISDASNVVIHTFRQEGDNTIGVIGYIDRFDAISLRTIVLSPENEPIIGPAVNTWISPRDEDFEDLPFVLTVFDDDTTFAIAGRDNFRTGKLNENGTISVNGWWDIENNGLAIEHIKETNKFILIFNRNNDRMHSEVFQTDGTNPTGQFGRERVNNNRDQFRQRSIMFNDNTFFMVFADEDNNDYGIGVVGVPDANLEKYDFGNFYVFKSQNMIDDPSLIDVVKVSDSPKIAIVVYTYETTSNEKVIAARIATITGNTLSYGPEQIIPTAGQVRKICTANFIDDKIAIAYEAELPNGNIVGRVKLVNSSFEDLSTSAAASFYENVDKIKKIDISSRTDNSVGITYETENSGPFFTNVTFEVEDDRQQLIGVAKEDGIEGDIREITLLAEVATGLSDANGDGLIPPHTYYLSREGTLQLDSNIGIPAGIALGEDKLLLFLNETIRK